MNRIYLPCEDHGMMEWYRARQLSKSLLQRLARSMRTVFCAGGQHRAWKRLVVRGVQVIATLDNGHVSVSSRGCAVPTLSLTSKKFLFLLSTASAV